MSYLVIGQNVWGRGATENEAFRKAGKPATRLVYTCDDENATVTQSGFIEQKAGSNPPALIRKVRNGREV